MSVYPWLKNAHVVLVALSLSGFAARSWLAFAQRRRLRRRWLRVAPHVVDTLLLASGVGLIAVTRFYPTRTPWLAAKLLVLLIYIASGVLVLRGSATPRLRVLALIVAGLSAAYMLGAALRHSVWSWLA